MKKEDLEKTYLKDLIKKVDRELSKVKQSIQAKKEEIDYMHTHMQDHKRDMDHLEKNALRETIYNYTLQGEHSLDKKKCLLRLRNVPYFGRIDFKENLAKGPQRIYVGVHNFQDGNVGQNLVYDWRAPISSMFYDHGLGEASYDTKEARIEGTVSLKRQFRIRQGEIEYMLDSDLTIHDDVLQRELNKASSSKMRNIVATIQREQNAIIRNEDAHHLIIQGVAGSGKTSIALHRIAFLLYKFKDTISSEDILIISPNKVFANYISNVLPELGEETVKETGMGEIATELFDYQVGFQDFFGQVSDLLEKTDEQLIERIRFKSAPGLTQQIDEYLVHLENTAFRPIDIFVGKKPVPEWFIRETFQKYNRLPMLRRFNEVVREIVDNVLIHYNYTVMGKERTGLHHTIRKMFPSTNLRVLYKGFYEWLGRPELLRTRKGASYEYSDVYPLLYLKMKIEGLRPFNNVKHLVVDEMQDYSAVQYKVLNALYPCKMTILGDINQAVNPYSSSDMETIRTIFPNATCMTMLKSYRSTYEITRFTQKISGKTDIEAIERHGEQPMIKSFGSKEKEIQYIGQCIGRFAGTEYNSLGIICKTQGQANTLYNVLKKMDNVKLFNAKSVAFVGGVVITTAHLAKGLEFDMVIVPFCTQNNYSTEIDRQMLYVACTRAMHLLELTCSGTISDFLE